MITIIFYCIDCKTWFNIDKAKWANAWLVCPNCESNAIGIKKKEAS